MESNEIQTGEAHLTTAAEAILKAAEKLFATKGLDLVSTREIARAAGQKNHSALQYHFGDRHELIDAILDYRMIPLNQRRLEMLVVIENAGQTHNVRELVSALVLPVVSEISKAPEDSYYISLMSQLFARHQADIVFNADESRVSGLRSTIEYLAGALSLSDEERIARMMFLGTQIVHTLAGWDHIRRTQPELMTNEILLVRTEWLIRFIEGALLSKPPLET